MKTRMTMKWGIIFILVILLAACGGSSGGSSDGGSGDTTSPVVSSTNPAHNATGVATNRAVTATFNEAIDLATINDISFILDDQNGAPITGAVSYDATSRTALFDTEALDPGTTYTATITSDVEDLAGNPLVDGNRVVSDYTWKFTTAAATSVTPPVHEDNTPPTVVIRLPAPDEIFVKSVEAVLVTFSEPIDPFTINSQSLTLSLNGTTPVAGTVTYVGTTARFEPSAKLVDNAAYTVTVSGTVSDLAGNPLGAADVWNFTNGSLVDTQPPVVLSVTPPDGAVNVPTDSPLVVNFNEAIKPFDFAIINDRPVTVIYEDEYKTAIMAPTAGLRPGEKYSVGIRVSDLAGNRMAEPYNWQFTTSP